MIESLPVILALLVVMVVAPFNWTVAVFLVTLTRSHPDDWVLRACAVAMIALATIVTTFALIFVNNDLSDPVLNVRETQLVTRTTLALTIIPAAFLLSMVRRR